MSQISITIAPDTGQTIELGTATGALGSLTGTVNSVGLSMPAPFAVANSPVTSDGTLTVTFDDQDANKVLAGPASGIASEPVFRTLVAADIPTISYNDLSNQPDLTAFNDVDLYANQAAFPVTGDSTLIYIAKDSGFIYRWNGTGYTQISVSGTTNLSQSTTSTTVTVASDTGTDAVLPAATTAKAGVLTAADKTAIGGIITGVPVASTKTAAYTFVATDANKAVVANLTAAANFTIDSNANQAMAVGTTLRLCQIGTGAATFVGATGVTLESPNGAATSAAGDFRTAWQRATDTWVIA